MAPTKQKRKRDALVKQTCRVGGRKRNRRPKKEMVSNIPKPDGEVMPLQVSSPKRASTAPTVDNPKRKRGSAARTQTRAKEAAARKAQKAANDKPKAKKVAKVSVRAEPDGDSEDDSSVEDEADEEHPDASDGSESDDDNETSGSSSESSDERYTKSQQNTAAQRRSKTASSKAASDINLSEVQGSVRRTGDELGCPFVLPLQEAKLHPPIAYARRSKLFRKLEKDNIDHMYLVPKNNAADGAFLMMHPEHSVKFSTQLMEYAAKVASREIHRAALRWPFGRLARFADKSFKQLQVGAGIQVPQSLMKPDTCNHEFPLLQPHVLKVAVALKHLMGTTAVLYIRLAPKHSLFYTPIRLLKPSDAHLETVGQIVASQPAFFAELSRQALIYLPTVVSEFDLTEDEKKLAMCEALFRMNETFAMRIKASNRLRRSSDSNKVGGKPKPVRQNNKVHQAAQKVRAENGNANDVDAAVANTVPSQIVRKSNRGNKVKKNDLPALTENAEALEEVAEIGIGNQEKRRRSNRGRKGERTDSPVVMEKTDVVGGAESGNGKQEKRRRSNRGRKGERTDSPVVMEKTDVVGGAESGNGKQEKRRRSNRGRKGERTDSPVVMEKTDDVGGAESDNGKQEELGGKWNRAKKRKASTPAAGGGSVGNDGKQCKKKKVKKNKRNNNVHNKAHNESDGNDVPLQKSNRAINDSRGGHKEKTEECDNTETEQFTAEQQHLEPAVVSHQDSILDVNVTVGEESYVESDSDAGSATSEPDV